MAILGTSLLGTAGCGPATREEPEAAAVRDDPIEVSTVRVRRGEIRQQVSAPGSVLARRESRIGPEVTGRIIRVFVEEGDRVDEGALLFQIDPEPYVLALRQALARLDLAQAERKQVEADLRRARELKKRDVVADQEMERLATSLAVARANERQAEEAVSLAKRDLRQTIVRAPYGASVTARLEDEGTTALVQPQTIVVVIQEVAQLEAQATIPESRMGLLRVGDPARVYVEGVTAPIETKISAVGDSIDPATRTYQVRMPVPNPDHSIKAGVFAHVEIEPGTKRDVLLVPREAIRSEDGRTRVFTIEGGRATPVSIRLGVVSDEEAEVLLGLEEGTEVIIGNAARNIAPGMKVTPVPFEGAAAASSADPAEVSVALEPDSER